MRSQSAYIPFPGSMIIYGWTQTDYSSPPSVYETHRVEVKGDTLIGAYSYKKLYSGSSPFIITAASRNDTLNKKVFIYSVSTGMEKLLYDFNLSVGDTVNSANGFGFYEPLVATAVSGVAFATVDTAWVTSIDSVLMPHDGLFHKRFNFSGSVRNSNPDSVGVTVNSASPGPYYYGVGDNFNITIHPLIEGVGQIYNPVSHYFFFEYQWSYFLACASINGLPYLAAGPILPPFVDGTSCNSLFTDIHELELSTIEIFPNPSNGKFQIKTEVELSQIQITDVLGKIIYQVELKNKSPEIDLSEKLAGVYFVRLSDSKGNSVVRKLIKN